MKYTNNEAYFDVIEEIDAIIDKQGNTVIAEVQGYVSAAVSFYHLITVRYGIRVRKLASLVILLAPANYTVKITVLKIESFNLT